MTFVVENVKLTAPHMKFVPAATALGIIFAAILRAQSPSATDSALQMIRPEVIQAHMSFLADDLLEGRGTGTRGFQLAANYVAAQFTSLGLAPAFGQSFFQDVPLRHADTIASETTLVISRGRQRQRLTYGTDFVTNGDIHRESVSITAPVVFVGFGIAAPDLGYDDYADVDVTGKIVAVLGLEDGPKTLSPLQLAYFGNWDTRIDAAIERGAVGVLVLVADNSSPWERSLQFAHQGLTSAIGTTGAPQAPSRPIAVAALRFETTKRLFQIASLDAEQTFARLAAGQTQSMTLPVTASMRIRSRHTTLTSPNVAAVVRGADPLLRDEYVIYTAHLDHIGHGIAVNGDDIYNGAIDNASGVAGMLAVARAVVGLSEPPRRSILFLATTGEEPGLIGSKYFTQQPSIPLTDVVAVINIDGLTLLYRVHDVRAIGAANSSLADAVDSAAHQLGLGVKRESIYVGGSDHYPFVRQGVPGIWVVAGSATGDVDGERLGRDWGQTRYHTPKDDMNQPLDFSAAATHSQLSFLIGYYVAQAERRPTWNTDDFFGERFGKSR